MTDSKLPIFLKNLATGVTTPSTYEADLSSQGGVDIPLDVSAKTASYWDTTDYAGKEYSAFPTINVDKQEIRYLVTNLTGAWTYSQKIAKINEKSKLCFHYGQVKDGEDIDPVVIGYKVVAKIPVTYYAKDENGKYAVLFTEYASPNTIHTLKSTYGTNKVAFIPSYMGTPIIKNTDADNGTSTYCVRVGKSAIKVLAVPADKNTVLVETSPTE